MKHMKHMKLKTRGARGAVGRYNGSMLIFLAVFAVALIVMICIQLTKCF